MDESIAIGNRIRELRRQRGHTQRELAEPGYTASYISSVEAGRRHPSTDALQYFAQRLGVDVEELRTGRSSGRIMALAVELADVALDIAARKAGALTTVRCEQLGVEAGKLGLDEQADRALLSLGRAALQRDELDTASAFFVRAEELLGVPAFVGRARCVLRSGDVAYAIYLLETALEDAGEGGQQSDPAALVALHACLVSAHAASSAHERAAMSAAEALALAPRYEDPERVARAFIELARSGGDKDSLRKAHEMIDLIDLRAEMARCHQVRAQVLANAGRLIEAEADLCVARDLSRTAQAFPAAVAAAAELADVHRRLGRADEAGASLEEAMDLLGDADAPAALAEVRRSEGMLALDQNDTVLAELRLREAAELFERAGSAEGTAGTLRLVGDVLRAQGRESEAVEAYDRGLEALCGLASRV